jgi:hypothetical protein
MKTKYCSIQGSNEQIKHLQFVVDENIDRLIERIELELDTFPDKLFFTLFLVDFSDDVLAKMYSLYPDRKFTQSPGYTDRDNKIIFLAVHNLTRRIVIHELTHMIINLYFIHDYPSSTIHELIAQKMEQLI